MRLWSVMRCVVFVGIFGVDVKFAHWQQKTPHIAIAAMCGVFVWWRWGESNPRPK